MDLTRIKHGLNTDYIRINASEARI